MYRDDQKNREDFETHPEIPVTQDKVIAMGRRDLKRRKRVGEIFAEGCLKTADDFAAAAMIFQHGTSPDHFYQTFVWSKRGVDLGDDKQKKLVALAVDRYLVNIGHKQLFVSPHFVNPSGIVLPPNRASARPIALAVQSFTYLLPVSIPSIPKLDDEPCDFDLG